MKYNYYNEVDFAEDTYFIQWVKNPNPENSFFWESWLKENPSKYKVIQGAKELVLLLSHDNDGIEEWEYKTICKNLQEATKFDYEKEEAKVIPIRFAQKRTLLAAAVSLLLIFSSILLTVLFKNSSIVYTAGYGQKRTIDLPDSSKVILNSNSKISYSEPIFSFFGARKVYLVGEAYFSVTHKQNNQPFIVQTKDNIQVEVLGTEFNVSERGKINRVVLASGKVKVHLNQKVLVMKPGDLVEVAPGFGKISKRIVNTEMYTSWKNDIIMAEETPLQEIITMLEHNYGYQVIVKDKSLLNRTITASFKADQLDKTLSTLAATFNIKIEKYQNQIIISQ